MHNGFLYICSVITITCFFIDEEKNNTRYHRSNFTERFVAGPIKVHDPPL